MVDRLLLLAAVNMPPAPNSNGVAKRLAVTLEVAQSALREAEQSHLVAEEPSKKRAGTPAGRRPRWRLSEEGRAELYRLLPAWEPSRREAAPAAPTRDGSNPSP